jgi:hypothetical protein
MHPAITLNKFTYRGYLDGKDIFNAICQSYKKPQEECRKVMDEDDIKYSTMISEGVYTEELTDKKSL